MVYISPYWLHDRDDIRLLGEFFDAKEAFELLKGNGYGGTRHETNDGCMRQELYDKP